MAKITPEEAIEILNQSGIEKAAQIVRLIEGLIDDQPLVWESTHSGYPRFISDSQYQKFMPRAQKWFRPVCQVREAARFQLEGETPEQLAAKNKSDRK